ncbi:MAG: hypothetical protein Hyperionvirus2_109 [Hyperionvirus sp.]|uniref:Uncharacterized protein n=1 Tax=Hyperionvirus sp. TaxID=2487770 RepID=A0A3G5A983_9VIRU|nr:MAG: hypothetical protein Hyperionvirus2_109 [Hyperionvirus sp.]
MTKKYIEVARLVGCEGKFSAQGSSVSLSGDGQTLAVGGPGDNKNYGAVWIFENCDDEWIEEVKLIPVGLKEGALAGSAVALSRDGDTLAVGAEGFGGTVMYSRSEDGEWIQLGYVLVGTDDSGTSQGFCVALSAEGDLLAVGDPTDNGSQGAVWLFIRSDRDWFQIGEKLVVKDSIGVVVNFGLSVSLSDSGDILAIGGPNDDSSKGATWVLTKEDNGWMPTQKIVDETATGSFQGFSVSLNGDGNILAVGGPLGNGAAWVYEIGNDGQWVQVGNKLIPPEQSILNFGRSVSLSRSGKILAIGAPGHLNVIPVVPAKKLEISESAVSVGKTIVFKRENDNYVQYGDVLVGRKSADNPNQGYSVSLSSSGCTLGIGGPNTPVGGETWIFDKQ